MLKIFWIVLLLLAAMPAYCAVQYCPMPDQLVKQGLWWHVGDTWKDYSQSFVRQIKEFYGAQWIGVKVGTIICLYSGTSKLTFKVALQTVHPVLVKMPEGDNWSTTKEGYRQCFSNNIKDCGFEPVAPQKTTANIYEQLKYHYGSSS